MAVGGAFGVVPAAGIGSRLSPYRAPKELVQVGYRTVDSTVDNGEAGGRLLPKAAIEHVLSALWRGGVTTAVVVVSPEKWEVPRYLGAGRHLGMDLAYVCQEDPHGMPHALDLAHAFVAGGTVCMGMPDTIVAPDDCFAQLRAFHDNHGADLSLGVFPTDEPQALAPVLLEPGTDRVLAIVDKPQVPPVANTWGIGCWSPVFTELLHDYVAAAARRQECAELLLSDVFVAAVAAGLRVYGLAFESGEYHDIGTPAGIVRTRRLLEAGDRLLAGRER